MLQHKFSSTIVKLLKNHDNFREWEKRIYRPISLQLAPTDRCNLKCSFCSVKNRDGSELDFQDTVATMDALCKLGLQTVELTGAGEPTLYPDINYLIDELHGMDLQIGIITNGINLVNIKHLEFFTWVRISMNCLDYVKDIDIPEIPGTLGFSYVINEMTIPKTLSKILQKMDKYNVSFLRVVPNCLSIASISESNRIFQSLRIEDDRVFWQEKSDYTPPHHCYIGYLKPFLNADGYFYHCSANPLIERKFHPAFRMGYMNEVDAIWRMPLKPFDTTICGECFFKEHNDFLDLVAMDSPHQRFL